MTTRKITKMEMLGGVSYKEAKIVADETVEYLTPDDHRIIRYRYDDILDFAPDGSFYFGNVNFYSTAVWRRVSSFLPNGWKVLRYGPDESKWFLQRGDLQFPISSGMHMPKGELHPSHERWARQSLKMLTRIEDRFRDCEYPAPNFSVRRLDDFNFAGLLRQRVRRIPAQLVATALRHARQSTTMSPTTVRRSIIQYFASKLVDHQFAPLWQRS